MLGRVLTTILFLNVLHLPITSAQTAVPDQNLPVKTADPLPAQPPVELTPPPTEAATSSTTSTTLVQTATSAKRAPVPADWLNQGIQLYQKGHFAEAETLFASAIADYPDESRAFYNLGLVEYKLNKFGIAVARWRQALDLNPNLSQAREALRYARTQLPSLENADFSILWWAHTGALNQVVLALPLGLTAVLILIYGILFIRYLKIARDPDATAKPKTGKLILGLVGILFFALLSGVRLWDQGTEWATNVQKKTAAHSTSSEDSASLFEIAEGQEVIILRRESGWYEIQMPSEKIGWVSSTALVPTSGD